MLLSNTYPNEDGGAGRVAEQGGANGGVGILRLDRLAFSSDRVTKSRERATRRIFNAPYGETQQDI